jgi:hypothetical protein
MKKSFAVLLIAAAFVPSALAQTTTPSQPARSEQVKVEALLNTTGTLFIKDIHPSVRVDGVSEVTLQAIFISSPIDKSINVGGVQFIVGTSKRIGFIDADEIPGVLAALTFLEQSSTTPLLSDSREITYTTRGGVKIGLYQTTQWILYVSVGNSASGNIASFQNNPSAITELRYALTANTTWLASKGISK